eukprot:m.243554 g.243554  ORF g.243554 m.243554 type:complete len:831 (-) comp10951_c0_seq1:89-2581(-)
MTSVPKPLKFLRPHYSTIKQHQAQITDEETKRLGADVVSLLAMTMDDGERDCLHYHMAGTNTALDSWGHEYVHHLQGELQDEWHERLSAEPPKSTDDLEALAMKILPFFMAHNAEADACDLVMEIERLEALDQFVDDKAHQRVCLYLLSCVPYVPDPENTNLLRRCLAIYRKFEHWPQALQMALKLNEHQTIKDVFLSCPDKIVRRQLAIMLGRQQFILNLEEEMADGDDEEIETLMSLISNTRLNESFLALARELDIIDAKTPEDIYKSHLEGGASSAGVDSARANLASTFVNAFVNAGFGSDKLILGGSGNAWIASKNRKYGIMSAAASLGLLLLWDVDGGLTQIDAYLFSDKEHVKAGALLAIGIVNSGVYNDCDPAIALLSDYTNSENPLYRIGANMGLGLAYAGSAREDVAELLLPVIRDSKANMEVLGVTALALGQIYVGTCDFEVNQAISELIMERATDKPKDLEDTNARNLILALGLLFLGKQQEADVTIQLLEAVESKFGRTAALFVGACAYAGTGNVLKIQELLFACINTQAASDSAEEKAAAEGGEKKEEEESKEDSEYEAFAVLSIALIAMGEEIGSEMALRTFAHLLQYGEPSIRRSVPIALALLCASNPVLSVLDTLSKLSHDVDIDVACSSIIAMGMVGAGTNHARVAGLLRHLAQYYHKEPNALFCVRIAQGLLHSGKGSVSLNPFHTDRTLMSPVAVSGLLGFLVGCLDLKNVLLKNGHYQIYHLALAMWPRILSTFDEDLNTIVTSVRVGQAVDVVGQAGKPKTITGFVTNTTPVLLGYGERAQLATEEYVSLTPILEGFVIVKKNPEYENE